MRIKLWGVRGSLPSPLSPHVVHERIREILTRFQGLRQSGVDISVDAFLDTLPTHFTRGYGGNTSCAEVTHGSTRLLIDGGSGLRCFSDMIMKTQPQTSEYHIYMTHFHWDHLIGLPFFVPLYMKGKTVHFYSVDSDLESSLRTMFTKPNFPVPYAVVEPQIRIHRLTPREPSQVGEFKLTPYQLDHPDACWGARVEAAGKALAWAVDNECTRTTREALGQDAALYNKADLLVFDAQYTFDEALEKLNWGHSSAPLGLDLSVREQVKRTIFIHHDPSASDETIRHAEVQTQHYHDEIVKHYLAQGSPIPELLWHFGCEGEVVDL